MRCSARCGASLGHLVLGPSVHPSLASSLRWSLQASEGPMHCVVGSSEYFRVHLLPRPLVAHHAAPFRVSFRSALVVPLPVGACHAACHSARPSLCCAVPFGARCAMLLGVCHAFLRSALTICARRAACCCCPRRFRSSARYVLGVSWRFPSLAFVASVLGTWHFNPSRRRLLEISLTSPT